MTTRRRFLTILAGASALPALSGGALAGAIQWRGIALGANARIILEHPRAEALIAQAVAEIDRLEGIFSLRRNSQLTRLNRDGQIATPAPEMLELFSICSVISDRTNGAFDPTIQPLWALHSEQVSAGKIPDAGQIAAAKALVGWARLRYSPQRASFTKTGMKLTLNGIAQGYIADRVAALLRANGVENVLVNTGEIMALGTDSTGAPWPIKIGYDGDRRVHLRNRAIATSAPLGTTFDASGALGHIIDPRRGKPGGKWAQVSVIATTAAEADGLSTAFCLMDKTAIDAARSPGVLDVILVPA